MAHWLSLCSSTAIELPLAGGFD
jgi:hypothetical protein